jgi:hypothetical protein
MLDERDSSRTSGDDLIKSHVDQVWDRRIPEPQLPSLLDTSLPFLSDFLRQAQANASELLAIEKRDDEKKLRIKFTFQRN